MAESSLSKKLLLFIDLVALAAAFFLSVFIRFHKKPGMAAIGQAYEGLYYLIFELILAIYVAVFFINESGSKPITEQNPFEKVVNVLKNQSMVMICLVVLLYIIKRGFWASRAVVIMMSGFSLVFDTVGRFIYSSVLRRKNEKNSNPKKIVLISGEKDACKKIDKLCDVSGSGSIIIRTFSLEEISENNGKIGNDLEFDEVLTFLPGDHSNYERRLHHINPDKPIYSIISLNSVPVSMEMISTLGEISAVRDSFLNDRCPVLSVRYSVTNLMEAVCYVRKNIDELKGKYICFGNVHTSVMAYEDREYRDIQNNSVFIMPDGVPIHREQRKRGFDNACRVAGPDFMKMMFILAMDGKTSMYFYGSTEETIKELEKNLPCEYPGIDVRGFESPPFRELTLEEDEEVVERINASGADIVWIGLGAPKQERWMAAHKNRINALMLGVGAGFDFHAGTVKRAPVWIQKIGMEWFYRLCQDPRRLLKRYVVTNTKFFIYKLFDRRAEG